MPIITNNPVTVDGNEYDKLGVFLAISPLWKSNEVGGSVAMRLSPYRYDENGEVQRLDTEYDRSVVFMDVFVDAQSDPALASAVTKIMEGIQEYIIAKDI